ncbi:MAG TPA: peptide deformylase [Patescibacteria group bacterium]|nr:peptide deformylase [Patescibacteria group bacterium]
MILDVVQAPNAVLSAIAQPIPIRSGQVGKIDATIEKLIEDMKETLVAQKDPEGIGLAAPQVGQSLQLFIVHQNPQDPFDIFINPKLTLGHDRAITKRKDKDEEREKLEGCLSLKVIWGEVERAKKVHMEWVDEKGKEHKATFQGFYATILQHEYDHLQGILFPRRVLEQNGQLYKSHKDKEGKDVFDPVEI